MEHDFWHKRKINNFDSYNVFLAVATNIPVLIMTDFVVQGHIYISNPWGSSSHPPLQGHQTVIFNKNSYALHLNTTIPVTKQVSFVILSGQTGQWWVGFV